MLEVFVFTMCIHNMGCTESKEAYLRYNVELQQNIQALEAKLRERFDERVQNYGGAVLFLATNQEATFKVGPGLFIKTNPSFTTSSVLYTFSY